MSTAVFVPKTFTRRPTFEQVLQASVGSGHLLQPPPNDQLISIPTFLFDGFPVRSAAEIESAERRKALYTRSENAGLFDPLENEKENTEIAMQAFIAEMKANRPKRSRWRDVDSKTYEEKFVALISQGPQTMESVVAEIHKTWISWNERPEKLEGAKRHLLSFCNNVSGFSSVLELIPNQSLYTGTLCSALKLLINASVNYEAMAEGFTRALAEIGQELATAKNVQALYNTEDMTTAVISLYSHIMNFFCFSMKWIKSFGKTKRFLTSFSNGGYWSEAVKYLEPITKLAQRIRDIAATAQMAENRDYHVKAEAERDKQESERHFMYCWFQSIWAQQQSFNAKQDQLMEAFARSGPVTSIGTFPGQDTVAALSQSDHGQVAATLTISPSQSAVLAGPEAKAKTKMMQFTVAEILKTAQATVEDHFREIDVHHDLSRVQAWRTNLSKELNMPPQAAKKIAEWFGANDATMLYIRSNVRLQNVINPITGLSANVITAAKVARIPTLYFFCGLNLLSRRSNSISSGRPAAMILMSMIQQALEWLEEFHSDVVPDGKDYSQRRFVQATNSAKEMWRLFEDVIGLLPKSPVIVCDLLEVYDFYDSDIGRLLDRITGLVPSLNEDDDADAKADNENKGKVGSQEKRLGTGKKLNSAFKILITSKTYSSLLDQMPDDIKLDVRDSKKGPHQKGNTKQWLELMATNTGIASSSNADTDKTATSDGQSTDYSDDDENSDNAVD